MKPKFCGWCGKELLPSVMEHNPSPQFDIYTGRKFNPEKWDQLQCPDFSIEKTLRLNNHDSYFNAQGKWLKLLL